MNLDFLKSSATNVESNVIVPDNIQQDQNVETENSNSDNTNVSIVQYIANLSTFEDRIKELHWSADNDKTHILCDELRGKVCELQDTLAEMYMGIVGKKFCLDFLKNARDCSCKNLPEVCDLLIYDSACVIHFIQDNIYLRGIKGELEGFIGYLQQILYKETQK